MQRVMSLVCDEDGSQLVEFALAATIFFTLIFGVIEFSLAIYAGNFVAIAAQQGTRYAMVRGGDWTNSCATVSSYSCEATAANVQQYILNQPHPSLNLTANNIASIVTVTWPGTSTACTANPKAQGCPVEVQISYPFQLNLPYYSPSITITSTSIETIQN